jgi:lipopolysaccharide exporter
MSNSLCHEPPTSSSLNPSESLSRKVVRGSIWVIALRTINRGLGFIRTIILARLLVPEDFGLLGVAMLSISVLEAFSQTGFQTALIQKKDNVESYLDTAWSVSVIRGIVLFLILFFAAPAAACFFRSDQITDIIRVIAISTLLSGFRNIGMVFFQKDLRFSKIFLYELSATVVDLGIAVTLAIILRNVWALVWAGLCTSLVRLIMSYVVQEYRPHFRFDKSIFLDLFGFSKWVVGSSILVFVITHGDDIFVGKIIGISALGLYQMAYLISNLPATEITHVISQVTFPAYSKLQDNPIKLRDAYLKVLHITAFISIAAAIGIFTFSSDFTLIFLGERWIPIVPIINILVFAGLVRSIAAIAGYVFYAVGKSNLDTKLQIVRLIVLALFIYPLSIKYGILGVSFAVFSSIFAANIGFSILVLKMTRCNSILFLKTMLFPLVSGLLAWILISGIQAITHTGIIYFFILVLSFMVFYLSIISLFVRFFYYKIWSLLTESYKALKA